MVVTGKRKCPTMASTNINTQASPFLATTFDQERPHIEQTDVINGPNSSSEQPCAVLDEILKLSIVFSTMLMSIMNKALIEISQPNPYIWGKQCAKTTVFSVHYW
jgi:hypothetical protein